MKKKSERLSTTFLYPSLAAVFGILSIFTVYNTLIEHKKLVDNLLYEQDYLLEIAGAAATDAFWSYNDTSLRKIGESIAAVKETAQIYIVNDRSETIYVNIKTTDEYKKEYLTAPQTFTVMHKGIKTGDITIACTRWYLRQQLVQEIRSKIIVIFILMASICFLILVSTRRIAVSLDEVGRAVKAFSEGVTDTVISIKSANEIQKLAARINRLFAAVTTASRELTESNIILQNQKESLRIAEERYRFAVEGSNDAIWDWNAETDDLYLSPRGLNIIGISEKDVLTIDSFTAFVHRDDVSKFVEFVKLFRENPDKYNQIEFRVVNSSGSLRWIFCRGKGILDKTVKLMRVSGFFTDITERINAEEAINRLYYYDVLTGLPNRVMVYKILDAYFDYADPKKIRGALLYIDLDNFKIINDTRGHATGDKLLVHISQTLTKSIEADTIARIGGDELAIVLKDADMTDARQTAQKVLDLFKTPWNICDTSFTVTCSIGITLFPDDGMDAGKLLMNADSAMFRAKEEGKNRFVFFDKTTNDLMLKEVELQFDMRRALENNEFVLYYQPQVSLSTGQITCVEALVRWQHPQKGLLQPSRFIRIAEETGMIIPIGLKIFETACTQSVQWEKEGIRGISMSVNFSAKQIGSEGILDTILEVLNRTGVRKDLIDIEITESIAMENLNKTIELITELRKEKVRFSLDDFGTGYSSLYYLNNLPIDRVKIDKQFISKMRNGSFEEFVVHAIIEIAHNMQLEIIAEGIETPDQMEALQIFNADKAQGYLFSKPVPADEAARLMKKNFSVNKSDYLNTAD